MADDDNGIKARTMDLNPHEGSVQGRMDPLPGYDGIEHEPMPFLLRIVSDTSGIPDWSIYPARGDRALREFYRKETILAGGVYSIAARIKALGYTLSGPEELRTIAQRTLETTDFNAGFRKLAETATINLLTQDNGFFWELVGPGRPDGPRIGPPTTVENLDPATCFRTFDPEFPVIYRNPLSHKVHKLHHSRVVYASNMPQGEELARGVGMCATRRGILWAHTMYDIAKYRHEKVSGQFNRGIITGKGVTWRSLEAALRNAKHEDQQAGMTRYRDMPVLTSIQGVELDALDLASIPDNFEFKSDTEVYVFALALAFGVDAREFWPSTTVGATKADASVQHLKSKGKGLADLITTIEDTINLYVMPDGVLFKYDFIDDERDAQVAEQHKVRTQTLTEIYRNGGITKAQYQASLIKAGVLDEKVLEEAEQIAVDLDLDDEAPPEQGRPDLFGNPSGQEANDEPDEMDAVEGAARRDNFFIMSIKSEANYRAAIRAAVRGLWKGELSRFGFLDAMATTIRRGFNQAWDEGAGDAGRLPGERTEAEQRELDRRIIEEMSYIDNFADAIESNSEANGGKLTPMLNRAAFWVSRYQEVKQRARLLAMANKKLKWVWDPVAEHCPDCQRLNGRVYYAQTWARWDIAPQSRQLNCFGGCKCHFEETNDPVTPGRPPNLIGPGAKDHHHHLEPVRSV